MLRALSVAGYARIAGHIRNNGRPFTGGDSVLQCTAKDSVVVCQECGMIPAREIGGWSSDWFTFCEGARRHALEEGHEVAVFSWNGAVYGPRS